MPKAWSDQDERQYEEIRKSVRKSGKSNVAAKEIAARTVNKRRRKEGRTSSPVSRATGNPNSRLEKRTLKELYNRAKELKIPGRSGMRRADLIRAMQKRR